MMTQDLDASAEAWTRVRGALRTQLGGDAFQNWIDPLVYVGADHGVVHLTAPTSFIGTWVLRNYGDAIRQLLCQDGIAVSRLEFGVAAAGRAAAEPEPVLVPAAWRGGGGADPGQAPQPQARGV
jgi:chromosomal replication initiator protein